MNNSYFIPIAFVGVSAGLLALQAWLSRSLGKKFDELLLKNHHALPISSNFLLPQNWGRTGLYAAMIGWNIYPKNPKSFRYRNYRKRFGDFYFRIHATKKRNIHIKNLYVLSNSLRYVVSNNYDKRGYWLKTRFMTKKHIKKLINSSSHVSHI